MKASNELALFQSVDTSAARGPPRAPDRGPRGRGRRDAGAPALRNLRILVVDDNVDAAKSLATLLQMEGNEVRTAFDGEAAMGEAEAMRPDAALLDIGLPKLDGYGVATWIREQPWARTWCWSR